MKDFQPESRCSRCRALFHCAAAAGESRCWCFAAPAVKAVQGQGCLCPACLKEAAATTRSAPGPRS